MSSFPDLYFPDFSGAIICNPADRRFFERVLKKYRKEFEVNNPVLFENELMPRGKYYVEGKEFFIGLAQPRPAPLTPLSNPTAQL